MQSFIDRLDPTKVRQAAVFATYGGQAQIGNEIKNLLQNKGIKVAAEPFTCKGKAWLILNPNRPNKADLAQISEYAQNTVKECSK